MSDSQPAYGSATRSDPELYDRLLEIALDAADRAARMLVRQRPRDLEVAATKSSPTDIVTEMDTAAERLITGVIRTARPDDALLGEESGSSAGTSGVRWVIDPIDGTVNYLYSYPSWSVSVAAEVEGESVVGVVAVPPLGEVFHAVRGRGAYLNHEPLGAVRPVSLDQALVATGFGYAAERRRRQGAVVAQVLPLIRDIRRGGSAAVDLCSVASGRVDAYFEQGVQRWDIAAGGLIAREAGVRVEGLKGSAPSPDLTIAARPGLFESLHAVLDRSDAAGA